MSAPEKAPTILTDTGARKLTDRIRTKLESADADLARAYEGRVWEPLGYASWEEWCAAELAGLQHLQLTIPVRLERTKMLRLVGASERAIAAATGKSPATAHADLQRLRDTGELAGEPETSTSLDGRQRPSRQPATEARAVAMVERHGLTILMHEAWQHVASRDNMTCLELEKRARWRHGRASSLLHRLERTGAVRRVDVFRDGYGAYVALPLD